jgi:two-component system, OmpR family, sensor histidine kinase KdpD
MNNSTPTLRTLVVTLSAVVLALGVALLLHPFAGLENVDLVFLTAVVAVAVAYGLWASLLASGASVLAYNFFFIPPLHTLEVSDPKNLAALGFFLVFAVITSHLAARARREALSARRRAEITAALYEFSRDIAGIPEFEPLLAAAVNGMSSVLSRDVVLLLPDDKGCLQVKPCSASEEILDDLDLETVRAAWSADGWNDRGPKRVGPRLFYRLATSRGSVGVIGLSREGMREPLSGDEEGMFGALSDQIAVAVERVRVTGERDAARLAVEEERLRSALLSSLSHDLKTPLASITGAITSLRQYADLYDAQARDELTGTIQDEAERMTRFVANLLDMTRLQTGEIALQREPVDIGEVVGTALQRTSGLLGGHKVVVDLDPALPMLDLDVVLFEQVLVNLLDNAAKYAPPGSTVAVAGRTVVGGVEVAVSDEGKGLASEDLTRVFDKFYRASRGDRQRAGSGLGLAICKGFVEALGGTIRAANREDRSGATFVLSFPREIVSAERKEAAE